MQHHAEIAEILRRVDAWPAEARAELEQQLRTLTEQRRRPTSPQKPTIDDLAGLAKGSGAPPGDEQVRQWVQERRAERHG